MSEILTKARARNVFYGGSLFFAGVFALMAWHTPGWSVAGGMALGAPAAWAFARHLRRLMAQADGEGS